MDDAVLARLEHVDLEPALLQRLRRLEDGVVLERGHHHVRALALRLGRLSDPEDGSVVRLGAAAGEDDLRRRRSDPPGERLSRGLEGPKAVSPERVETVGVAIALGQVREHRLDHARIDWRRR
jgi:hypothetical protein